jgi:hypothetical protein
LARQGEAKRCWRGVTADSWRRAQDRAVEELRRWPEQAMRVGARDRPHFKNAQRHMHRDVAA